MQQRLHPVNLRLKSRFVPSFVPVSARFGRNSSTATFAQIRSQTITIRTRSCFVLSSNCPSASNAWTNSYHNNTCTYRPTLTASYHQNKVVFGPVEQLPSVSKVGLTSTVLTDNHHKSRVMVCHVETLSELGRQHMTSKVNSQSPSEGRHYLSQCEKNLGEDHHGNILNSRT